MAGSRQARATPNDPATLLCIDDQAQYLPVRKAFLESQGYEVLTASNGPDGLRLLQEHEVNAVILDYNMPDMSGEEVAREIRRIRPEMPIILLSGYPQDIPESTRSRVNAVVIKGQRPEVLLDAIRAVIPGVVLRPQTPAVSVDSIQQVRKTVERALDKFQERRKAISDKKR